MLFVSVTTQVSLSKSFHKKGKKKIIIIKRETPFIKGKDSTYLFDYFIE